MSPPSYFVGTAAVTENLLKRKWSVVILRHLGNGITNPADITSREANLSAPAMNERLRNMLRFGLIARFPRSANAKAIEYRLTKRGEQILEVLTFIEQLDNETSPPPTGLGDRVRKVGRANATTSNNKRLILKD